MRQHVVAELLGVAQSGAVPEHDPRVRAQHCNMVGDVFRIGGAYANINHGDATAITAN